MFFRLTKWIFRVFPEHYKDPISTKTYSPQAKVWRKKQVKKADGHFRP